MRDLNIKHQCFQRREDSLWAGEALVGEEAYPDLDAVGMQDLEFQKERWVCFG